MDAGDQSVNRIAAGYALLLLGVGLLAVSLFLDRADDYFYDVANNHLIGYSVLGPVLIGLIVGALVLVFSPAKKSKLVGPALLVIVSLACLGLTIIASKDLGVHPTDMGDLDNTAAMGTYLSIAASAVMLTGSLLAVWGAVARPSASGI